MKESFRKYLGQMGLWSEGDQKRLFDLYHVATRLIPGEIGEIFVSQVGDRGVTDSDALWFFTKDNVLEIREFLACDDFEVRSLGNLVSLRVVSENFDLQKFATGPHGEKASLTVEFTPRRGSQCRLHAYGENCVKLAAITLEYLKPGLEKKET